VSESEVKLKPAATAREAHWARANIAGLIALGLGALAFAIPAVTQNELWTTPDWRLTVPFFLVTAVVTGVSFLRRERLWALPLVGLGAAGAAMVLGWFVVVAAIVAATAVLILILSTVL
jgi:hypothetical protein